MAHHDVRQKQTMKLHIVILSFLIALAGCSQPEPKRAAPDRTELERRVLGLMSENSKLKSEVDRLQKEIDGIKNSPAKYLAEIKLAFEAEKYDAARQTISKLIQLRPETPEAEQAKAIGMKIEEILAARAAKLKEDEIRKKAAAEEAHRKSIANLRTSIDEVNAITWHQHRSSPDSNASNGFFSYIGKKGDDVWLRLKITYTDEDWLFIKRYTFNIDGSNYPVSIDWGDRKSDNSGGQIWEWVDLMVDSEAYALLEKVRDSKRTILRYEGNQYYKDRDVSQQEKQAVREILIAYEAMGGKPKK